MASQSQLPLPQAGFVRWCLHGKGTRQVLGGHYSQEHCLTACEKGERILTLGVEHSSSVTMIPLSLLIDECWLKWKLILLLSAKKVPAVPNGGALERCFYLGLACQVSLNGLTVPTAVTGALKECAEGEGNVRDPAG